MTLGIYILADDRVSFQLNALLESLRTNMPDVPTCIIPYSHRVVLTKLIAADYGVELMSQDLPRKWQRLGHDCLQQMDMGWHKMNICRRFMCFDNEAPFDEFLMLDADVIVKADFLEVYSSSLSHNDLISFDLLHKLNNDKSLCLPEYDVPCNAFFMARKQNFASISHNVLREYAETFKCDRKLYPGQVFFSFLCYHAKPITHFIFDHCEVENSQLYMEQLYPAKARELFLHWVGVSNNDIVNGKAPYQGELSRYTV